MKNILITGCSTGFGFLAAKVFAQKGHHVYATMRNIESSNKAHADELRAFAKDNQVKIDVLEIDVTSDKSVNDAVAQIDKVDVLINNAGRGYGGPIEAFTSQQVLDQLDLNIVGNIRMVKAVLPKMRAQKSGLIIQLSSIAGRCAVPGFGVYHASKWGVEGLSESMRYELSPLGIDVVIVQPGPFETQFFSTLVNSEDAEIASAYEHVGKFGEGFASSTMAAFADPNAPTDPIIIVEAFENLINMPNGSRPLRTMVGLNFGLQAVNEVTEPIRQGLLQAFEISDWDGPRE
ncbi:SDR family oxidoreductase [Algoriphagus aquimarinus]|uniref:SDR family oxidoreductase n=1 Tax=Algoriphagus aquimarinus TaxID=237018 RepID=A0A5C7AF09_9BACT|nr:SDR family oxidoreductase [Algoriphagus aquimarinus]TXE03727.1 SDR family oxidoreductase [Algoriphagus aquimarinus]